MGGVVREATTVLVRRRSQRVWVGYDEEVAMQETRGSGRGCGNIFFDGGATQYSNDCRQTTMTKTQLLEHSRGSGLDHEHRLLSGVPGACELGVFGGVVGCICRESLCCGGCNILPSCTASFSVEDQHLKKNNNVVWNERVFL